MTYPDSLTTIDLVRIAACAEQRLRQCHTSIAGEIDTIHAMVALAADHGGRMTRSGVIR